MPKKRRKSTDAQLAAVKKYQGKMAELKIRCKPEEKEAFQKAADAAGKSLNKYVIETLSQRIQRDKGKPEGKTAAKKTEDYQDMEKLVQEAMKGTRKSVRSHADAVRKASEGR